MNYVTSYSAGEMQTFRRERVCKMPLSGLDLSMRIRLTEADWIDLRCGVEELFKTIFSNLDEPSPSSDANGSLESMSDFGEDEDDMPNDNDKDPSCFGVGDGDGDGGARWYLRW